MDQTEEKTTITSIKCFPDNETISKIFQKHYTIAQNNSDSPYRLTGSESSYLFRAIGDLASNKCFVSEQGPRQIATIFDDGYVKYEKKRLAERRFMWEVYLPDDDFARANNEIIERSDMRINFVRYILGQIPVCEKELIS